MMPRMLLHLLLLVFNVYSSAAVTDDTESAALRSLRDSAWENTPANWVGNDPCGDAWVGIGCTNTHVTSITLANIDLSGGLTGDISSFTELQTLDLSYNKGLTGPLPESIGNLKKLKDLLLVGCSFNGPIPDTIGSLQQLVSLSLNSNGFIGKIPHSIGNLSNLYWLDLADNQLDGSIPVSNGTTPGLDKLIHTKHFHLGQNKLSGNIPAQLFSSEMVLIHVLFDGNALVGPIPDTLGLVQSLEVIRFDGNSLSGNLPSNINNLTSVHDLYFSNNKLTGPLPDLTGMNSLNTLDLSNNSFNASTAPAWFSSLPSLTTLIMEKTQLEGGVPVTLFSLPYLQTVNLKDNDFNGTLDIGTEFSDQLQLVDLQNNQITEFNQSAGQFSIDVRLEGNLICRDNQERTKTYCLPPESNTTSLYTTPPENCLPALCSQDTISSPKCMCAYPYSGTLFFRGLFFSDLGNKTNYVVLEQSLMKFYKDHQLPVDSVLLDNPRIDQNRHLQLNIAIFPSGLGSFNKTGVSMIAFSFSNQTFKPPPQLYGPYFFTGDAYKYFSDEPSEPGKSITGIIIGAAVGSSVLVLLLLLAGAYAYRQKKRAERATEKSNPFAHWDTKKSSGGIPQLKGARCFSFEELKKYTNNFSDANDIGSGGYGKVYRGALPTGELVAIKRAQQGSMQGGLEFKTEIELLSRVHHKNVVGLLGFCFERGEQMLIYEYISNGSLYESLSGKSGIRLDWPRRLKIALGAARGLQYLHELANPPIIHRDIKSTNILLDDRLTAKVADFGLSKLISDSEKGHVTTQVKGTMGYLDPEYYMTQQLTEKSDVYSFGVLLLELITARRPIERGKYIVREVRTAMDKSKDLYNLHQLLDPAIHMGAPLKGVEKFVDLAMRCVGESGADRPTMGEVVKEIEFIMQLAGMNPNAESASSSATYEDASKGVVLHPYSDESFAYSGAFPAAKIEPQ